MGGDRVPDIGTTERSTETQIQIPTRTQGAVGGPSKLVVVSGAAIGTLVEIGERRITVGRDPASTLVLSDGGVSREHAVFEPRLGAVVVRDAGSKNGTWVNGIRVEERLLTDGDLVGFGSATVKLLGPENPEQGYYVGMHAVAMYDPLTALPNRRYLNDVLARETARASRNGEPLHVALADVDHFKRVNDTFGHLAGDMVLRRLGSVVGERLRKGDFAARYGGEEIAFVLPGCPVPAARGFGESLRGLVARTEFRYGETLIPVTISIGIAAWRPEMGDPKVVLERADERLYAAKQGGRNRVEVT